MADLDNVFGVSPVVDGQAEVENTQETQDVQTPEQPNGEESTPVDGQVEQTPNTEVKEEPLILGKFKTQEDLVKAYQNLQSQYTRVTQERVAPKQEQPQVDEEGQVVNWFENTLQENPTQAIAGLVNYLIQKNVAPIQEQVKPILDEQTTRKYVSDFQTKHPDYVNYVDAMQSVRDDVVNNDPEIVNKPEFYEKLYFMAKIKTLEEQSKAAFENGKKTAADKVNEKKKVFNEQSKANKEEDVLPEGINIVQRGDGIFL